MYEVIYMIMGITNNLDYFTVKFDYSGRLIKEIKQIKGAYFDHNIKCWKIPISIYAVKQLFKIFSDTEIFLGNSLKKLNCSCKKSSIKFLYRQYYLKKTRMALLLKGYSKKTLRVYLSHINRFLRYFNR